SISQFPEGIEPQALRLCELHVAHRNLREVCLDLWWERYSVDLARVRKDLVDALGPSNRVFDVLPSSSGAALDLIEDAAHRQVQRRRDPAVNAVRRNLSRSSTPDSDAQTVLTTLGVLALGERLGETVSDWFDGENAWTNVDGEFLESILRRGLGID